MFWPRNDGCHSHSKISYQEIQPASYTFTKLNLKLPVRLWSKTSLPCPVRVYTQGWCLCLLCFFFIINSGRNVWTSLKHLAWNEKKQEHNFTSFLQKKKGDKKISYLGGFCSRNTRETIFLRLQETAEKLLIPTLLFRLSCWHSKSVNNGGSCSPAV